ncbi:hypothetical protein MATL_G00130870 [Megalops atlanticus]|uniref:Uncharacterized protein n=1 Tax=Megalops atlanticus TaxID=7932 RepID=A0A9D3PVK8_MEGAT|nr:hypothetical protein MATL_G00130870 [Megalops atlanticus]
MRTGKPLTGVKPCGSCKEKQGQFTKKTGCSLLELRHELLQEAVCFIELIMSSKGKTFPKLMRWPTFPGNWCRITD